MEKKVIDELCRCGHKKSEHNPSKPEVSKTVLDIYGHGSCTKCDCKKFTWKQFIFEDE